MTEQENTKEQSQPVEKNMLEWTVFFVSLTLVSAIIFYLLFQVVNREDTAPDIQVSWEQETLAGPGKIKISVSNEGGTTAADVIIQASLMKGDSLIDESEVTFPFIPRYSERTGWCLFRVPLGTNQVNVRVAGYRKP